MKVLESFGADTTGLQLDTSIAEDESVLYQDLSDVVAALAEKLSKNKNSEKFSEKVKVLEESLAHAQKETEELKALKSATEKRLEASKAAARGSRAEAATVSAEVDFLREQLEQRSIELESAKGRINGSADAVSSEVQALEEENIELMKENMELRKETSTCRLEIDKVKAQLIKQSGGYSDSIKAKSTVPPSGRTPQAADNQENRGSAQRVAGEVNAGICEDPLSVTKTLHTEESKGRRVRKARPLVDTTNSEARGDDAEGGECAQS